MDKLLIGVLLVAIIIGSRGVNQTTSRTESSGVGDTRISEQVESTGEMRVVPTTVTAKTDPLGEEGSLSVSQTGNSSVSISEGQTKQVFGISITARGSQIYVERISVDLGTSRNIWLGLIKNIYVVDSSGQVLAKTELNKNTVSSVGSSFVTTLAGFSYAVKKNETGYLFIRAETYPLIDTSDGSIFTVTIPQKGVRARDARGASIYAPVNPFSVLLKYVAE